MGLQQQFNKSRSISCSLEFLSRVRQYGQIKFDFAFLPSRRAKLKIFERVWVSHGYLHPVIRLIGSIAGELARAGCPSEIGRELWWVRSRPETSQIADVQMFPNF